MKEIMLDKELKSKGIDTEIKDKMVGEKGNLTIVKYGEDHYVLLRDAIFKHLDKLGTLDKKKHI